MTPNFFLSPLENILKENKMEIWTQTKLQVIADLALIRHRASSDALIIQETFARTLQIILVARFIKIFTYYCGLVELQTLC